MTSLADLKRHLEQEGQPVPPDAELLAKLAEMERGFRAAVAGMGFTISDERVMETFPLLAVVLYSGWPASKADQERVQRTANLYLEAALCTSTSRLQTVEGITPEA